MKEKEGVEEKCNNSGAAAAGGGAEADGVQFN